VARAARCPLNRDFAMRHFRRPYAGLMARAARCPLNRDATVTGPAPSSNSWQGLRAARCPLNRDDQVSEAMKRCSRSLVVAVARAARCAMPFESRRWIVVRCTPRSTRHGKGCAMPFESRHGIRYKERPSTNAMARAARRPLNRDVVESELELDGSTSHGGQGARGCDAL
jgi:hypothetical protein